MMHFGFIPETTEASPEVKTKAGRHIRNRVASGKIKRESCVICGNEKTVGHHYDYSKPLDVYWLCHKHHLELHRNERKASGIQARPGEDMLVTVPECLEPKK